MSGKYLDGAKGARYSESDPMGRLKLLPEDKLRQFKALAEENGFSMATLSLAWVAAQPGVTSPIIGARSVEQLKESVTAVQTKVSPELAKSIDEIFTPGGHDVPYYQAAFGPNARV